MAHRTKALAAEAQDTGIARLVEAERVWREELAAAERSAAELIAQARREVEEGDAAVTRELEACVVEHRAAVLATLTEKIAVIGREAEGRAERYRVLSDAEVERLAARLLSEVWWPEPARPGTDAGEKR